MSVLAHQYTVFTISTSVHQYISTSVHQYISTSVHQYISTSVHQYISTCLFRDNQFAGSEISAIRKINKVNTGGETV